MSAAPLRALYRSGSANSKEPHEPWAVGCARCGQIAASPSRGTWRYGSIVTSVPIVVYGQIFAAVAFGASTHPTLCGNP